MRDKLIVGIVVALAAAAASFASGLFGQGYQNSLSVERWLMDKRYEAYGEIIASCGSYIELWSEDIAKAKDHIEIAKQRNEASGLGKARAGELDFNLLDNKFVLEQNKAITTRSSVSRAVLIAEPVLARKLLLLQSTLSDSLLVQELDSTNLEKWIAVREQLVKLVREVIDLMREEIGTDKLAAYSRHYFL